MSITQVTTVHESSVDPICDQDLAAQLDDARETAEACYRRARELVFDHTELGPTSELNRQQRAVLRELESAERRLEHLRATYRTSA